MMEYKGYIGKVDYDDDDGVFHGMIVNITDVVTFFGTSVKELRQAFKASVEDYLAYCEETGKTPDKPYSGKFNVRLDPDLHRQIATQAKASGMSLNAFVAESLQRTIQTR